MPGDDRASATLGEDKLSKIGFALAGGGPLGGSYEIGASVALSESIDGFEAHQADIFVGVSSGGFIAAALANGITPARLAQILIDDDTKEIFDPEMLLRPAFGDYFSRLFSLPHLLISSTLDYFSA